MSHLRAALAALTLILAALASSAARADGGTVRISFIKAGWVIGGSVGGVVERLKPGRHAG